MNLLSKKHPIILKLNNNFEISIVIAVFASCSHMFISTSINVNAKMHANGNKQLQQIIKHKGNHNINSK